MLTPGTPGDFENTPTSRHEPVHIHGVHSSPAMPRPIIWGALLVLGTLGCSDNAPSEQSYEVEGPLCAAQVSEGVVRVRVQLPTCLSSSCDRVVEEHCAITADGDILRVDSHWTVASSDGPCTTDCGYDTCTTEVENLAPGVYTLRYGAASVDIEVPSETTVYIDRDRFLLGACDFEQD